MFVYCQLMMIGDHGCMSDSSFMTGLVSDLIVEPRSKILQLIMADDLHADELH